MRRPQIKIPEIEYYQIVSSHAQIWPQGAEKQLSKVNVVVVVVVGVEGKRQYCSWSAVSWSLQELVNLGLFYVQLAYREDLAINILYLRIIIINIQQYLEGEMGY